MKFPQNFPDIGGWDFERVWKERQEWCQFALKWKSATGLFKEFQMFCKAKNKKKNGDS